MDFYRKLLRLEVRNSETPIEKKPSWIKTKVRVMRPEQRTAILTGTIVRKR